jgi:uncharacterized protein (TIGR03083 family)
MTTGTTGTVARTADGVGATKARRRRSALDHATAQRLAATEYGRWVDVAATITPEQWQQPTDCTGWDVRSMVAHVVGMTEMWASIRELVHQLRTVGDGGIDVLTGLQVSERADAGRDELVARLRTAGPRACRLRHRAFRLAGRQLLRPAQEMPMGAGVEWWSLGYLLDTILTRDPWMHRIDLARATGVPMTVTADHDGVIVADVVQEWATRHGRPFRLRLTGPAGGSWHEGAGGAEVELDALEFCRSISGRDPQPGLLSTSTPF